MTTSNTPKDHENRDPITGEPGAHPVGVGVGAAAGGIAAGAAVGTVAAGPIGTAVGAAVGAVVGALGGKAVAERMDPTTPGAAGNHDSYWRANHAKQPYYVAGSEYEDYEPAYRLGSQPRTQYANRSFDEVEPHLAADYERTKSATSVEWDKAKHAVRAAWDRVTNSGS